MTVSKEFGVSTNCKTTNHAGQNPRHTSTKKQVRDDSTERINCGKARSVLSWRGNDSYDSFPEDMSCQILVRTRDFVTSFLDSCFLFQKRRIIQICVTVCSPRTRHARTFQSCVCKSLNVQSSVNNITERRARVPDLFSERTRERAKVSRQVSALVVSFYLTDRFPRFLYQVHSSQVL